MSVEYSGDHSINFYTLTAGSSIKKNTWKDFKLIPEKRPSIAYPVPNTKIVVISGTNKRLDLTDYHAGGLTYGPRAGTWDFFIDHTLVNKWRDIYDLVYDFVHGKELYVTLSDEPTLFYRGMFSLNSYIAGNTHSKVTIQYDLGSESFILDEHTLLGGDGDDDTEDISLLERCPIKFIGENGSPYVKDYGFKEDADYLKKINAKINEVEVYDLIVLESNG